MSRTSTITKHQRHQVTNSASDVCLCIRRFEKCQSGQFQKRRAIDSLMWQFNIPQRCNFSSVSELFPRKKDSEKARQVACPDW